MKKKLVIFVLIVILCIPTIADAQLVDDSPVVVELLVPLENGYSIDWNREDIVLGVMRRFYKHAEDMFKSTQERICTN
jgi:hypothetical protein